MKLEKSKGVDILTMSTLLEVFVCGMRLNLIGEIELEKLEKYILEKLEKHIDKKYFMRYLIDKSTST